MVAVRYKSSVVSSNLSICRDSLIMSNDIYKLNIMFSRGLWLITLYGHVLGVVVTNSLKPPIIITPYSYPVPRSQTSMLTVTLAETFPKTLTWDFTILFVSWPFSFREAFLSYHVMCFRIRVHFVEMFDIL